MSKKYKQFKRVKEDRKNSEDMVSLLRLEVLELHKQNKEKMILIEDLSFKVETTNKILEDNTCNSCKDTDTLKGELSQLKSMYDDLLEKHSKSSKVIIQQNNEKEFKETIACKHCSFQFSDHQILKDHMKNEHCIKCNYCNLTFKCKNGLQKHEQLSHQKNSHAIDNMLKCNFCDMICSEENVLLKHIKKEHKIKCNKCFIAFMGQESKNNHTWDYHSKL